MCRKPQVKKLLRGRSRWLIGFGFVHAVLLFPGDILGLYGVVGFILVALTRVPDRKLLVAATVWLGVAAVVQGAAYMMPPTGERSFFWSFETADPIKAMLLHPFEWLMTPIGIAGMGSAVLVGTWAARRGVLTGPAAHRPLLVRTAVAGLTTAFVGGLPVRLAVGHFWEPTSLPVLWVLSALHAVTGIAGGLGYAAAIGLLAIRVGDRRGRVVRALAAGGQLSLSGYLFQSVVFVVLLMPYTLGLGARLGTAGVAAGVAEERARLAREIHDTVAQGLTGIVTQLEAIGELSPAQERRLDTARALAGTSLDEVRRSIDALRPGPLQQARLGDAVRQAVAAWSGQYEIPARFTVTGVPLPVHSEVEVTLLRTAQEALSNVGRPHGPGVWTSRSPIWRM